MSESEAPVEPITFSVVIPAADRPDTLAAAVASVLAQSQPAMEVIVVDNGLTPIPPADYEGQAQVRLVRALPRFGAAQARNLGMTLARGTHVAFLDDDDRWDPEYLEAVRRCIVSTGAPVILGNLRSGQDGSPFPGKHGPLPQPLAQALLTRNPGAGGSTTIVARDQAMATAGFDPYLTTGEDKAFVLDLLRRGCTVTRAEDAWADISIDAEGERQTLIGNHVTGKWRFLRKYWASMGWRARLTGLAQLLRLLGRRARGKRL